jgi:hypothetical protein
LADIDNEQSDGEFDREPLFLPPSDDEPAPEPDAPAQLNEPSPDAREALLQLVAKRTAKRIKQAEQDERAASARQRAEFVDESPLPWGSVKRAAQIERDKVVERQRADLLQFFNDPPIPSVPDGESIPDTPASPDLQPPSSDEDEDEKGQGQGQDVEMEDAPLVENGNGTEEKEKEERVASGTDAPEMRSIWEALPVPEQPQVPDVANQMEVDKELEAEKEQEGEKEQEVRAASGTDDPETPDVAPVLPIPEQPQPPAVVKVSLRDWKARKTQQQENLPIEQRVLCEIVASGSDDVDMADIAGVPQAVATDNNNSDVELLGPPLTRSEIYAVKMERNNAEEMARVPTPTEDEDLTPSVPQTAPESVLTESRAPGLAPGMEELTERERKLVDARARLEAAQKAAVRLAEGQSDNVLAAIRRTVEKRQKDLMYLESL